MEPIIRAILDSEHSEVRRILAADAKAAWTVSQSGKTPVQLAFAADNFPATAAILRNTPQCIDEIQSTAKELLERLIGDFSQSVICSSWNRDIEYELWALVSEDTKYQPRTARFLDINRDYFDDIGWFSSWVEGWFHWPDSEDSPVFVAIDEWKSLYQNHYRG